MKKVFSRLIGTLLVASSLLCFSSCSFSSILRPDTWFPSTPSNNSSSNGQTNNGSSNSATTDTSDSSSVHEHMFGMEYIATEDGHYFPSICGHHETEKVRPHSMSHPIIQKEATTTEEGLEVSTCRDCGYTKESVIPMIHVHSYSEEWTTTETQHYHEATCEHDVFSDKADHTFGKGVIVKEATETEDGEKRFTCTVCNYEKTESYKLIYKKIDETSLYFGSYPQTEVTDTTLVSSLNKDYNGGSIYDIQRYWKSYGYVEKDGTVPKTSYMYYRDVDVDRDGTYDYRGVYYTKKRPISSAKDGGSLGSNTTYWFKYEPVKWKILENADGKAMILSELLLDSQYYSWDSAPVKVDGKYIYSNNYERSYIRKWLNETFYNTAFSKLEKTIIEKTEVDNGKESAVYANGFVGNNTNDNVFLLSYKDTQTYFSSNKDREASGTDYAVIQGLSADIGTLTADWWLRTPYSDNNAKGDYAYYCFYGKPTDLLISTSYVGVRPVCWITLDD